MQKKLQAERQDAEDPLRIAEYFQQLQEVITDNGILLLDIWNIDETGFCIGVRKD